MDRALIVVRRRREGWRISGRSIAVLAFLAMCAAFFCVPLYVMLVTSFKTMDQIRFGDIFALPVAWSLEAWKEAWFEACAGVKCEGLQAGFVNSLKILFPSLALSIAFSSVKREGAMDTRLLDEDRIMQICFVTDNLERSVEWFAELTGKNRRLM